MFEQLTPTQQREYQADDLKPLCAVLGQMPIYTKQTKKTCNDSCLIIKDVEMCDY